MYRQATRQENDTFRRDIFNEALGLIVISPAVAALPNPDLMTLFTEIQCFEDWDDAADPCHSVVTLSHHGQQYCFRIRGTPRPTIYIASANEQ
jgi:hypothetical protein